MSVSLALIPLALALRAVMSKDKLDDWVDSMQVKVETKFENELDLVRTLQLAGYDAEKYGGNIKTHINGENFFYWEQIDGKWHALFSKQDDVALLEQFMGDVELSAGRRLFVQGSDAIQEQLQQDSLKVFPTNFRDGGVLVRTLKEFGVNAYEKADGEISCVVQGTPLTFRQNGDAPFTVEIKSNPNMHEMYAYLSDIDEEYKRCLQSVVYEKLKQRAAEKNLSIESEEVLEDNSIVITLNIQG
ncbi:hypothetical protein [Bacillus sp. EB01]|uniref:hypothetical protein n=1 Tax=Bacillus sp. EB01 TaxID=1347086 RepID=UPI0005C5F507|nr:hypothetical protein [Bacillus sp. EB01]